MDLEIACAEISDTVAVMTLTGELDVYTSFRAREKLVELIESGRHRLVVDVSLVDFIDSTGLGVLVGALKRCRAHDGSMLLVVGSLRILIVFRITGLCRVFRIFDEVPTALEAVTEKARLPDATARNPHEYTPRRNSFFLQVHAGAEDDSARFSRRVLSYLAGWGIEPVFLLRIGQEPDVCETVVAVTDPISQEEIIQSICDDIEGYFFGGSAPESDQDIAIRELAAAFHEAERVGIRLGNAVIAYADRRIAARVLSGEQLFDLFHKRACKLSAPKKLINVLSKI